MKPLALVAFGVMLVVGVAGAVWAAACTVDVGGHVMLESDAVDPDVFLWDSRERLVDYTAGQWGNTKAIFAHTIITEPGTRAVVMECFPGIVHSKFSSSDAIGVRLVNGPYRGRYGWVLSSDVHPARRSEHDLRQVGTPKN